MAEPILTVEHLIKAYGETPVLDDISFAVKPGEVIVVVGPSGCGKSTLLRCLNGLEPTQSGRVRLGNETVAYGGKNLTQLRQRIGMVFQSFNLFNNLTVLENCMIGQTKVLKRSKEEAKQNAMKYLEKVGMAPYVKEGQIVVCVAKGIEEDTLMTLSEIVEQEIPVADVAVMCGPSHAEEVGRGLPTTVVAGAHKKATAEAVQDIFMNEVFRVYTSPDVLGMELGGSLKNVIALAAGMADGLGYGDNTKAALITRGITEMGRLALEMGAKYETLSGLTGIGDLIVTCESRHSRNRKAGMLMGQGYTMKQATDEVKMVVEGIYSAKAAIALAHKYQVDMPIIEEVNKVLFEDKPAKDAVKELMMRDRRAEHSGLEWEA